MTVALLFLVLSPQEEPVRFGRDIQPILSRNCFACHGPDAKNADSELRLDRRERALSAIVPGDPAKSELWRRITASEDRMPPPKSGKKLDSREIALLKRWIEEGAEWERHWAFVPPVRNGAGIDALVRARLEREGLKPSPEADRETLLRRVTLDLAGLPPTLEELGTSETYEQVVDRLLASPRFGERMALEWMDAARYADTHGLHVDSHREMWPWRDWVIRAFNANLPFDRFTVEQLAGDLLPGATIEQRTASGFNRNHMISYQGSSIPEKVRVGYIVDRVNTTAAVWLGLTMGCAQCHDHKFDPLPQADYYRLFAFFNSIAEKPLDGDAGNAAPVLMLDPALQPKVDALAGKKGSPELKQLLRTSPNTMVMAELPRPRETRLLKRGEYNQPGEKVDPGTPGCLPPMAADLPKDRLGLARWLVDPKNPLTARVAVNRLWQMLFGTGLVESSEDFGAQGEFPSHPELLDALAVDFVEKGWDVKAMVRQIVLSATYRQSSKASHAPSNRLLARGPRFRMPAEMIRDSALAASGLLVEKIGGPSVFPYQPPGVWEAVASQEKGKYTAQEYRQGTGDDLYRRSLYTFWKRLAPPPAYSAFDAPTREVCTVRRQRTNTPLQALVTLNDPTFVEAARALAERAMKGHSDEERATIAFRRVLARSPSEAEMSVLLKLRAQRFDPESARRLLAVGESRRDPSLDPVEHAAWTMVASAILNLDEALTKE